MRNTRKLPTLAGRLEHRYPDVHCIVERHEYEPNKRGGSKGHALWELRFFADDRATLIEHGLASAAQFEARAATCHWLHKHDPLGNSVSVYEHGGYGRPKAYEVNMLVTDYNNNDEKPFTKKLQTQVARALRPFFRGTWRPPADADAPR